MPANVADLLTVSGLVSLTVLIVALFKALPRKDGAWYDPALAWIQVNQFLTSIIVAFSIAGIVYVVQYFGYMQLADKFWQGALFLWAVAQALYNGQKGLSHVLRGQPN